MYDGQVDDPYDEFLIVEREGIKKRSLMDDYNSTYWTERYYLCAKRYRNSPATN